MNSDILLFDPPLTERGAHLENYALLWMASYLKKRGIIVRVFYLDKKFKLSIKLAISKYNPKYVAISCKWYTNLYSAILVAKEVKKINNAIRIIAGGHTATYFDRELLRNSDFDIVIRGDAEHPLVNILKNKIPINCTLKENGKIVRYKQDYVQTQKDLKGYRLVEPRDILENPNRLLRGLNFIWISKGCMQNCFYCGGSASAQKKIFGRKGLIYRPIKDVLTDIALMGKYSRFLQFDSSLFQREEIYYLQLFKKMPRDKFICRIHHWHLPTKDFIDHVSETFKLAFIVFDTSTLCEGLRKNLSEKKLLKPFFSNKALEDIIQYCNKKKNINIELHNIAGMPGERNSQVKEQVNFTRYLIQKYPLITLITYLPLSIEPGSILQRDYRKFNMHCYRSKFSDYFNLSKQAFESNNSYPYSNFFSNKNYKNAFLHPYGICEIGLSKKSSYLRAKYFHEKINNKLLAQNFLRQYAQQKILNLGKNI